MTISAFCVCLLEYELKAMSLQRALSLSSQGSKSFKKAEAI